MARIQGKQWDLNLGDSRKGQSRWTEALQSTHCGLCCEDTVCRERELCCWWPATLRGRKLFSLSPSHFKLVLFYFLNGISQPLGEGEIQYMRQNKDITRIIWRSQKVFPGPAYRLSRVKLKKTCWPWHRCVDPGMGCSLSLLLGPLVRVLCFLGSCFNSTVLESSMS